MNEPITFIVPQLNGEGVKKAQEIATTFTAVQRAISGIIGGSTPEMHIVNQKLTEAWLLVNYALVATARRVAA